jgi:peptide subunit release factor 1 (eRF1)
MATTTTARNFETLELDLQSGITRLREMSSDHNVLSCYLDTSPLRAIGHAYLTAYRDGVHSIYDHLLGAEPGALDQAIAQVEHYLTEHFAPHARGLGVFCDSNLRTLIAVALPKAPLVEHVAWGKSAEITPLEMMLDDYERIAVALFDTERTRLLTVFLGAIEHQEAFEDYVPGKQATGGWFGLQQTSLERHREDHLRRHARRTVLELMRLLRTRSFDRLLIGGPDEALAVLRHALPRPLEARLAGTLNLELFASDVAVLDATLHAARAIEQLDDQVLVDELLEVATSPHVVLGVTDTLDALAAGRVHLLILAGGFAQPGGRCFTCGRLVNDAEPCPTCGTPAQPLENLREPLVRQALDQGARIETVSGKAAERLAEHGGIGAWTRF